MPPQLKALDVRYIPPYACSRPRSETEVLSEAASVTDDLMEDSSGVGEGNGRSAFPAAARRIYGPMPPPPQR